METLLLIALWCGEPNASYNSYQVNECRAALAKCIGPLLSPNQITVVNCIREKKI